MIDTWATCRPSATAGNPSVTRSASYGHPRPSWSIWSPCSPREPHLTGRYHPMGIQMNKVVEGKLTCWALCEQGRWWGLVTYRIRFGPHEKAVTHWVPAWVLRPHEGQGESATQGARQRRRRS